MQPKPKPSGSKTLLTRRSFLRTTAFGLSAISATRATSLAAAGDPSTHRSSMGVVIYALGLHQRLVWGAEPTRSSPCLAFLEHCRRAGAGGIQYPFTARDSEFIPELRRRAGEYGMFVEAIVNLPADASGLEAFEAQILLAREAGAEVARTVMLPGRRYEQFTSHTEFKAAEKEGIERLQRAEPIAAKHRFRLAVENHKDQLVAEKVDTMRRLDSEYIGLCVDVGNNFPLLEDPLDTMRAFAPWAFTAHLKDQAVRPSPDGFLMADVALGEGCLDLPAIVEILRSAQPRLRFNYETITRDPLSVPVLTPGFWATLPDRPASHLARVLAIVRNRPYPQPFIKVSSLPPEAQLRLETDNLETSLAYARNQLRL